MLILLIALELPDYNDVFIGNSECRYSHKYQGSKVFEPVIDNPKRY